MFLAAVIQPFLSLFYWNCSSDERYVKQKEAEINKRLGIKPEEVEQYRTWLKTCQEKGYFHSDASDHIKVDSPAEQITARGMWEEYLSRVDTINKLIDMGIYSFSEDTGLVSRALKCIRDPSLMKSGDQMQSSAESNVSSENEQ